MARGLFIAGTVPYILLGGVHVVLTLLDVRRPRWFTPVDDRVREGMQATPLALYPKRSMWPAWLGFNISHGLGLVVFGTLMLLLAIHDMELVREVPGVGLLVVGVSAAYLGLSIRFWFWIPTAGAGVGLVCFVLTLFFV